jgi:hypothetical protein
MEFANARAVLPGNRLGENEQEQSKFLRMLFFRHACAPFKPRFSFGRSQRMLLIARPEW